MGFYIRKSFSSGPVRFNLSKSGLGMSFGVKGARIGVGPRGTYTHFGRYGLYYRSAYSGGASLRTDAPRISSQSCAEREDSLFGEKQINSRRLTMEVEFRKKKTKEAVYAVLAFGCLIGVGAFAETNSLVAGSMGILFGIFIALIISEFIKYLVLKHKSNRLYQKISTCFEEKDGEVVINFDNLNNFIELYAKGLDNSLVKRAFVLFYKDYLERVICDVKITQREEEDIKKLQEILSLEEDLARKVKLWIFNKAYLEVIEDKFLSKEEEKEIFRIKNILGLSDNEISEEIETLNVLREAREIQEGNLDSISVDMQLNKDEACFHRTKGRVIKDKTLYSYQSQGVRHNVKGLVIEKEGDLYLTSKRIFIVGEGVYTIKLEKIFNIETDIDKNLVILDIESRKNQLKLTVPDSLIFCAKLNRIMGVSKDHE